MLNGDPTLVFSKELDRRDVFHHLIVRTPKPSAAPSCSQRPVTIANGSSPPRVSVTAPRRTSDGKSPPPPRSERARSATQLIYPGSPERRSHASARNLRVVSRSSIDIPWRRSSTPSTNSRSSSDSWSKSIMRSMAVSTTVCLSGGNRSTLATSARKRSSLGSARPRNGRILSSLTLALDLSATLTAQLCEGHPRRQLCLRQGQGTRSIRNGGYHSRRSAGRCPRPGTIARSRSLWRPRASCDDVIV